MTRPIEVGCRAEIVNSFAGNDGMRVRVLDYVGTVNGFNYKNRWRISSYVVTTAGDLANHMGELQLRRIDDDLEVGSWDDCVWVPDALKEKV